MSVRAFHEYRQLESEKLILLHGWIDTLAFVTNTNYYGGIRNSALCGITVDYM